ncbi:hypothetical protein G5I_12501 [Acromyrmex echinatior]|uniref:Double jelly roll-like domain-containing protein n=1 Tax=Acromyrmex echinatior TaxID=103372 RepID=F4X2H4_ACREC|nr:hypothetical protein G5I_12501 [Acromyrmex echinatior]
MSLLALVSLTSSAYMKNSENRETLDKSETNLLKSKSPRNPGEHPRDGTSKKERRGKEWKRRKRIIYEDLLRAICKNVVVNACHELILIRAHNDYNCLIENPMTEPEIELFKVQWRMPHVALNETNKLSMLRASEHEFSWDLNTYPLLQNMTKYLWAVKTVTQLEKPRYVIYALQTGRKNIMSRDVRVFDDYNLSNVKVYLNSEFYPYDDLNLDFSKKRYAV